MSFTHNPNLQLHVSALLQAVGIAPHTIGCHYLRDALLYTYENKSALFAVTKDLYPEIAKRNLTTTACIEHSIRHAIANAYQRQQTPLSTIFFARGKPTNSEFIAILTEYLLTANHPLCMGQ